MVRTVLVLLLALFMVKALAQQVVQGRVVDAITQEPLAFVHVLAEGEREGATTDIDGRFVLRLAGTQATVRFSYVGYAPHTEILEVGPPVVVRMQRATVELPARRTMDFVIGRTATRATASRCSPATWIAP
jgi:hypothetical protein